MAMAEELQVTELPPVGQPSEDPAVTLIAIGRERGHVTGEQIAAAVEEVELGPDGVRELHSRLVDAGVEVDRRRRRRRATSTEDDPARRRRSSRPT